MLEREPMQKMAQIRELMCYKYFGFWQCMDNSRLKVTFDWRTRCNVEKIVEWSDVYMKQGDFVECMRQQITEFLSA